MYLLISAITPVVIFLYLIYNQDTLKEPLGLVGKCFLGGVFSVVPAVLLSTLFSSVFISDDSLTSSFYTAFIVAGLSEEVAKFVILYWIIWKNKEFDQHYDGIIYAVSVSLGFAVIENILYVLGGGYGVALARAVLAVPGHGFFAVSMGYFFALAKFSHHSERKKYLLLSLFIPVVLHGLYDFFLIHASTENLSPAVVAGLLILFTVFVILLWRIGLKRIKIHVEKDRENLDSF
ncbi:PrsW family intramembrane metalloprotease [Bacteroidales bacterium OttesenSCG-928-I21]|nr:PrsW family intramembrane metalloprotease [Bacteroidales bacterium OttesenSCG-928-I21]